MFDKKMLEKFSRNIIGMIDVGRLTNYNEIRQLIEPLLPALDKYFVYNIDLGMAIDDWLEYLADGNTAMATHQRKIVVDDLGKYFS